MKGLALQVDVAGVDGRRARLYVHAGQYGSVLIPVGGSRETDWPADDGADLASVPGGQVDQVDTRPVHVRWGEHEGQAMWTAIVGGLVGCTCQR